MDEPGAIAQIAIVGRPNVGKSTMFNRLLRRRIAIVDDRPGVTRDSIVSECRILGKRCFLVDTGGLSSFGKKNEIETGVDEQILRSIESADVILFVVDSSAGPMPEDRYVAQVLRRMKRRVVFVSNKADGPEHDDRTTEFCELGMDEPMPVSALHGRNIMDLQEKLAAMLPESAEPEQHERITFCIVGRPNVGKSSLTNAILGQDRCIVSSTPGTTRDSIQADFTWNHSQYTIIDTAGQRRRKRNLDDVEFYSINRARNAIKRCDVAVLILDAEEGLFEGEKRIASAIQEYKRGFLLVVNKMDLIPDPNTDFFIQNMLQEAPFLRNTPILFVSALEKAGMDMILDNVADIYDRLHTPLPQELLENLIYDIRALFSPRSKGRRIGEIRGVIHDRVNPPRIVLKVNDVDLFPPDYMRLIENRIRDAFNLAGVPLDLTLSAPPKSKKRKK